jgi:hypothetical protein
VSDPPKDPKSTNWLAVVALIVAALSLVVSVLGYARDRARDPAQITLSTDVDSVDIAGEGSRRCIRHYNVALEAANSGFRRLTVTKVFAVTDQDSLAELFYSRKATAAGAYSGERRRFYKMENGSESFLTSPV